jgi:uncharacterized FlgJ-related protein
MADFRRPTDLNDPQLKQIAVLMGKEEMIDLWGGSGLEVFLTDTNIATVAEQNVKLGPQRRRFVIKAKVNGETTLEARVGGRAGNLFVTPLKIRVPTAPSKSDFIAKLVAAGTPIARKYKLPLSVMIGQAMLESANGASSLALLDNILYGITKRSELSKGQEHDWYPACKTIVMRKTIAKEGEGAVPDRFCAATTFEEAVEIWAQYVTKHPHSKKHQAAFKDGPWSQADVQAVADLMPGLMFGNGNKAYPGDLMKVIQENDLMRFDK